MDMYRPVHTAVVRVCSKVCSSDGVSVGRSDVE